MKSIAQRKKEKKGKEANREQYNKCQNCRVRKVLYKLGKLLMELGNMLIKCKEAKMKRLITVAVLLSMLLMDSNKASAYWVAPKGLEVQDPCQNVYRIDLR